MLTGFGPQSPKAPNRWGLRVQHYPNSLPLSAEEAAGGTCGRNRASECFAGQAKSKVEWFGLRGTGFQRLSRRLQ